MSMDLSQTIAESSATSDMGVLTSYTLYNFILFYSFLFLLKIYIFIYILYSPIISPWMCPELNQWAGLAVPVDWDNPWKTKL